ncbi:MAG TPA: YidC/Oxa1 family insertase periplasmic-domain containing protein [Phycisphaerae bacterium]|nr:YidC/Oxa1 family insertase periplasmic-domain containing protein [Phycisphaerae bacterium]
MDTRQIFTTIILFIAIFFAVQYFTAPHNNAGNTTLPTAFTQPATQPLAAEQGATPLTVRLGDPMGKTDNVSIVVDNVTAGIDEVNLNLHHYAQTVARKDPLKLLTATPGAPKPYSTLIIEVNDGTLHKFDLYAAQYVWKVESTSPDNTQATLLATLLDDNSKPLVEVRKIFTIHPDNYDVEIAHAFKNLTGKPITVRVDELAAPTLPRTDIRVDDRTINAGSLDSAKSIIKTDRILLYHAALEKEAAPTKPIGQANDFDHDPFLWVSSSDRFFTAITRPLPQPGAPALKLPTGQTLPEPQHVASSEIDEIYKAEKPEGNVYAIRFTGAPITINADGATSLPITAYFGPKDRNILMPDSPPLGTPAYNYKLYNYGDVIQFTSTGCILYSYCSFQFLAIWLLVALDFIARHIAFGNYGIAIFILVILVRAILHPLTKSSQINMATMAKKMNAIKPKIDAVKKKYANDKKREQEETMRVYRENNVNPAGGIMGCLPMLIQMPIWIAMYQGLWNDLDLRHATFIPGWITDLAAPDALFSFPAITIPFLGAHIASFNLLPILLGVVFFFQMKIQTATQPKPTDEQQAQMQKMSQWMFLILPIFLYNAPAGLNLYYFASTAAGLVDTYIVRKTLKKRGILPASAETLPTHYQEDDDEKK